MKKNYSYLNQYKILHANNNNYGASSIEFLDEVCLVIEYLRPKIVLDYGCGKGELIKELENKYSEILFYGYDPAVFGKENLTIEKADLIINTDVLEHVPEVLLPDVIKDIRNISNNVYFNLHHALAKTILPNGENAHCTVKSQKWYHEFLGKFFENIVPLKGRREYLSVVLTFEIDKKFHKKYKKIIFNSKIKNICNKYYCRYLK